jgi:peptidoglycan hydrolase FlgJ
MSDLSLTAAGRIDSRSTEPRRLRQAADQFEASFLQQILKPLEEATVDEQPLIGGDSATNAYKGLYHRALTEQSAGGLGIADVVFNELSARAGLPGHKSPQTPGR